MASDAKDLLKRRQENVLRNRALVGDLGLKALQPRAKPKKAVKRQSKPKVKEEPLASRKSLRLQKITPDNVVQKRQIEQVLEQRLEEERARKRRRTGDLDVKDLLNGSGLFDSMGNFLKDITPSKSKQPIFNIDEAKKKTQKDVREAIEKFDMLSLWENIAPNRIKVVPERAYSLSFHPTESKSLVFTGDKYGNLGIFDSANSTVTEDPEDEDNPDLKLAITQLKIHTKSITSIQFRSNEHTSVYTSSYDSSVRQLDLEKEIAVEVFAPSDDTLEEGISYMQLVDSEPHMVYFTTLAGRFGTHDTRVAPKDESGTTLYGLSEKKIGGFSIHPSQPYLLATASLDRTLRLWDLRKIEGKGENRSPILIGEHTSRLSISSASFNHFGQVATSSYDDTIKIYDFNPLVNLGVGKTPDEENYMEPKHIVRHNNQTGRWVTILKPYWQTNPTDGLQKFAIGNMDKAVDIFDGQGHHLAQLTDSGLTAVPAVAQLHPTLNWVAGVNSSGKLSLWM